MKRMAAMAIAIVVGACASMPATSPSSGGFTTRLTEPRLAPVDPADPNLTEAQRDMLGSRNNLNIYKTLVHHVDLYNRWSPLGQFILNGSSISPRHREMAMLRMGWLCQSPYEWAQHARIAKTSAGMSEAEVHAIAEGPEAPSWTAIDRAVLTMADELRYDAMISDKTWADLRKVYSDNQVMELLFTSSQYQLVSMALNSLGIQVEPAALDFIPKDVPLPKTAGRPSALRLSAPRIRPVAVSALSAEQRSIAAAQIRPDGTMLNLYGTLINHPKIYAPRARFGTYLQRDSMLDPVTRELAIMRTAYNINASYEWAHHVEYAKSAGLTDAQIADIARGPSAPGWGEQQRAVLQAADELRREAFISDRTWAKLAEYYDMKRRIEIVYTVGGYSMTGFAINSFGIETEPGYPQMPR